MSKLKSSRTIAAEIEKSFKAARKLLLESMSKTEEGTRARLDHTLALAKLEERYRDERARRGIDSENLGMAIIPNFIFNANIAAGDFKESAEHQLFRKRMDKEFGFSGAERREQRDPETPQTEPEGTE